jgi:hypothetical protein
MDFSYATILWAAALAVVGFVGHYIVTIAFGSHSSEFRDLPRPKVKYPTYQLYHSTSLGII